MGEFNPVTFYQGAPIDVSQLNKLQQNITSAYTTTNSLLNATTTAGSTQSILPVVYADTVEVKITGGKGDIAVTFTNKFNTTPTIVASLAQDPKDLSYAVSALATGTGSAKIYVVGPSTKNGTVKVSFIAVENRLVNITA